MSKTGSVIVAALPKLIARFAPKVLKAEASLDVADVVLVEAPFYMCWFGD